LADVGAESDVVVVCVFTDEQVQQVCLESVLLSTMRPCAGSPWCG
jgi:3-hydroxyisobutyrate dehydrogenase-like beta-hydroxyacid dehydrogenase